MRIVMDAAGDIPADLIEELNITVIPVNIMFGTEEFLSGIDIDHAAFYRKVQEVDNHNFPKTSQPTPYQFEQLYKQIIAEGEDEILTITVSEKLSGTYASAVAAARALEGQATFHLFDSRAGAAVQGLMVVEAARMARDGQDIDAILQRITEMRDNFSVYFLIDTLEYAVKGGRVSSLRGAMANILNIKPIMTLDEGLIVEAGKVRTYKKALDYIVNAIVRDVGDRPVRLAVMHAGQPEAGQALLEKARPLLNTSEELFMDMAIAVAINLGPGALGLVAMPE
jgi:DegV family protein with EDD domain